MSTFFSDAMPFACYFWNGDLRVFQCNEENVKFFDLRDEQEFLDHFCELSPKYQPDGRLSSEKSSDMVNKALEEGKYVGEWQHQKLDGTPLPVEITLVRAGEGDGPAVAAFLLDLREQKRIIEDYASALNLAQKSNAAQSNFLANISHEMRTPLNAIIGLADLTMGYHGLNNECVSNLEKISNAGLTLLNIVNDVIDIAQMEAGKFELILSDYDIPSMINDTITQSMIQLGEKTIEFVLDIDGDLPARLCGDELRIKQIINNLLSNAFKYTKEGKVTLSINCIRDGETVWMTIRVQDSGIGIRQENLTSIFEDYSQMDMRASRGIMGTGLGLSITKKTVELMKGAIQADSEFGEGSVFTVKIPQQSAGDGTIGQEMADNLKNFRYNEHKRRLNSNLIRISLPYARVLIVDDMPANLDVAKGLMRPYGMQIDCLTGGQQAIDAIREEKVRYNAIFMDHMMPGMDGIEAARRIRAIGSDYAKTVPIIALTANAVVGNEDIFLANGFQAFIAKPIDLPHLDAVIRRWVRDKEQEQLYVDRQMQGEGGAAPNARSGWERRAPHNRRSGFDRRDFGDLYYKINVNKGIECYGGDRRIYLRILRSYAVNTKPLLNSVKSVNRDNLTDYAITVHGIKGSSRGIFAEAVGDKAATLEKAAKSGDFDLVSEKNLDFIEDVEKLIAGLECVLGKIDRDPQKPLKGEPERGLLEKLSAACQKYNMDEADAVITELERFEYESGGELIAQLRENADEADFKGILDLLSARRSGGERLVDM